jgi:hypothetical protein
MNSPEIEAIIEQAVGFAKERTHEYCTIAVSYTHLRAHETG